MKPAAFEYVAASSVEDAVEALASAGDGGKILAGGQSLVPLLALRLARPEVVVDVNSIAGLDRIVVEDHHLRMGALVRQRAVERDEAVRRSFPLVSAAAAKIGHVAIRNRGTVGGSVAHADPAAEWPALLLALDGEVETASPRGRRIVPAAELFGGYLTTSLEVDEMICEVRGSLPEGRSGTSFLELARREGDFAIVGVAAVLAATSDEVSHCRVALSGVASTPVRVQAAEDRLVGTSANDEDIAAAAEAVADEIGPPGDVHGSADYRKKVAKVLVRRALVAARHEWEGAVRA
ncbi:MAG TPA: xanthine dehydrogenase family protein subunit M [Acidimicrobiales bacterium]|jgi:carbon-monoxide dehydrogenase medium subunit|nr:xanthine dehydrogenase family protein subunit M [Acidimicrobiales bacterium]